MDDFPLTAPEDQTWGTNIDPQRCWSCFVGTQPSNCRGLQTLLTKHFDLNNPTQFKNWISSSVARLSYQKKTKPKSLGSSDSSGGGLTNNELQKTRKLFKMKVLDLLQIYGGAALPNLSRLSQDSNQVVCGSKAKEC